MLTSKRLRLRAIAETDLDSIATWRSDPAVYEFFYEYLPISVRQQRGWYEKQMGDTSEINLVIARADDNAAIGTVSIYHLDRRSRKAEWGRLIIAPEHRSAGFGAEVEVLVLEYAFEHLNLHKLYCEVLVANESVVSLHKKLGFVEEGVLRHHTFKGGQYVDAVILSMLEAEYVKEKASGKLKGLIDRFLATEPRSTAAPQPGN